MNNTTARIVRTGIAAVATVGLLAATPVAAGADGHGGRRHHRHHHHHHRITDEQKTCMADHGFVVGHDAPRPDFRDPAVRERFLAALRDCGIVPPAPVPPTTEPTTTTSTSTTTSTTTTTTTEPVIVTS